MRTGTKSSPQVTLQKTVSQSLIDREFLGQPCSLFAHFKTYDRLKVPSTNTLTTATELSSCAGEVLKELASCGLSKLRPAFIKFHMYRKHRSVHPSLCFVARAKRVQRSGDSTWFDSACLNAPIWKTMSGAYPLSSFPQETVFNLSG